MVDGFETYHVMNPHDDGIGIDTYVDWLIEAGYPIKRIDDFGEWVRQFETALRALPDRQRQHSVLQMLQLMLHNPDQIHALEPTRGSFAPTDRFRAAVQEAKIGPDNDIPHISAPVIIKYVTDLQLVGLLKSTPARAAPARRLRAADYDCGEREDVAQVDRSVHTMTSARVPGLPIGEAKAAADEAAVPDYMAELSIFQVLLNHPQLARAVNDLLATMLWHGSLDARLRELVIMRIGWLTACEYEWTQHWRVATRLGVTADDLLGVRDWQQHHAFGPTERAVLAATDDVVRDGAVSAESWAACERELQSDKTVLVELVTAISAWRMVSSILQSLDVPLEDGVAGWPPDGRAPAS